MKSIVLSATDDTPSINFDYDNGIMEIKGKSTPENSLEFYKPLWNWIEAIPEGSEKKVIKASLKFEYINSSSLNCLIGILLRLKSVININKNVEIKIDWYYNEFDDDMIETGQECDEIGGIPFNMIEI